MTESLLFIFYDRNYSKMKLANYTGNTKYMASIYISTDQEQEVTSYQLPLPGLEHRPLAYD